MVVKGGGRFTTVYRCEIMLVLEAGAELEAERNEGRYSSADQVPIKCVFTPTCKCVAEELR